TYEQATMIGPLLSTHHIHRMFLVASRLHIRRAVSVFRSRQYDVVPIPSAIAYQEDLTGRSRFVPQASAMALSRDAIYEYVALAWPAGWACSERRAQTNCRAA